jgi:hypothetical protein
MFLGDETCRLVGPLDPASVQSLARLGCAGLAKIDSCPCHASRNCSCYTDIRESLLQIRTAFTEGQPEGWLASRIVDELEAHGHFRIARPIGNFTND